MLSSIQLEQLSLADVDRTLYDSADLVGYVRIERHPATRVVVDFITEIEQEAACERVRVGTWPDCTLTDIRQRAARLRRIHTETETSTIAAPSRALYQGASSATMHVRPPRPSEMPQGYGPLFDYLPGHHAVSEPMRHGTVTEVFTAWVGTALSGRKDLGESVRRSMEKDVLPTLGSLPARALRHDQIANILEQIVQRGSARQAGCVLADLRQMFRWASHMNWVDVDPTASLRKSDFGGSTQARHRHLNEQELAELAAKLQAARLARHIRHAIWLLLATGARIGELAMARWSDIDFAKRLWTIPAQYSHSGRAHEIPLSQFAVRHLRPEGTSMRDSEWVFPGRFPTEPLSPKALGKQIRDRQRGTQIRGRASATTSLLLSGGAWTPLDLRRSTAALLASMHIRPDVINSCLDHGGRDQRRNTLLDARREAFEQLGARLEAIEIDHTRPTRRVA